MTLPFPLARKASQRQSLNFDGSPKYSQRRGLSPTNLGGVHMFHPNLELGSQDSGGLFLFMGRISPLSPELQPSTSLAKTFV